MPRRADKDVGPADHRLGIIQPSRKPDAPGHAAFGGQRFQPAPFRPVAGNPQGALIYPGKGPDQRVEGLVRVKPSQRGDHRSAVPRPVKGRTIRAIGHEIDLVMDPVRRHAFANKIVGDAACVRHQPVAAAVMFQLVEPAKPRHMRDFRFRDHGCRPVHPAEDDVGAARGDGAGELAPVKRGKHR